MSPPCGRRKVCYDTPPQTLPFGPRPHIRVVATTRSQLEGVALAECSLLRTQLPATFMTRSSIALTAEFLRWRDHVDVSKPRVKRRSWYTGCLYVVVLALE